MEGKRENSIGDSWTFDGLLSIMELVEYNKHSLIQPLFLVSSIQPLVKDIIY